MPGLIDKNIVKQKRGFPQPGSTVEDVMESPVTTEKIDPYSDPVHSNTSVARHVESLIDKGGPLFQLASTRAKQGMNRRGLLNSSMTEGAVQKALIETALPIAQQDAGQRQDLHRMGVEASSNLQGQLAGRVGDIQSQAAQAIQAVQTASNIDPGNKKRMVDDIIAQRDADIQMTNSIYSAMPAWQSSWSLLGGATAPGPISPVGKKIRSQKARVTQKPAKQKPTNISWYRRQNRNIQGR